MKKVDLTYPRKFICVESSSLPSQQLSFNEIANHIAKEVNRTPYERMQSLLEHNLLDKARKEYLV